MAKAVDIYTQITNKIISDLEKGVPTWVKPWNTGTLSGRITLPLRHNGQAYRGLNILLLWLAIIERGYTFNRWMTYKQARELGGQVMKGTKGEAVIYADAIHKTETDDNGQEIAYKIPFMKSYTVFNVEQIDGLPDSFYTKAEPVNPDICRDDTLEAFFTATKATIRHGGSRAFYNNSLDFVQMPPLECFITSEAYYATLAHEMTHWTRHERRLNRKFGRKRWGDEGYAQEELVAELGAAFVCAELGITPEVREDHASYIQEWLKVLKNDRRAVFTAAAHAQRAVDYLKSFQQPEDTAA